MRALRYIFIIILSTVGTLLTAQNMRQYNIHIVMPDNNWISGIVIIRHDSTISTMSIVNEFGIKMFDAKYSTTKQKTRLYNIIKPLNKWHIRKTIAHDMTLLFNPKHKSTKTCILTTATDGTITIANNRNKIKYTLRPIDNAAK